MTLTEPEFRDSSPVFDPTGKYLYFLSWRTFDPVYDNLFFDLGFPLGARPYLVTLQADRPSPFLVRPEPGPEGPDGAPDGPPTDVGGTRGGGRGAGAAGEAGATGDAEPDGASSAAQAGLRRRPASTLTASASGWSRYPFPKVATRRSSP